MSLKTTMFKKYYADNANEQSIASRLRKQRFQLFVDMLNEEPFIANILDVGGTQNYWEMVTAGSALLDKVQVTLLNIEHQKTTLANFTSIIGVARATIQFIDKQFDFVFSNSTIEHVGNFSDQRNMAKEIMRVGKYYYVQTPNRYFPIEPHFLFPFF